MEQSVATSPWSHTIAFRIFAARLCLRCRALITIACFGCCDSNRAGHCSELAAAAVTAGPCGPHPIAVNVLESSRQR
jgi:hypothetical protein